MTNDLSAAEIDEIERRHAIVCEEIGDHLYALSGMNHVAHEDRGKLIALLRSALAREIDTFAFEPDEALKLHNGCAIMPMDRWDAIERTRIALKADNARMLEHIKRCGDRLGGITTPMMEGDNLAVTLCSRFDNPDQEEDGETGWTPDAIKGCDEVLAAIRAYYTPPQPIEVD